MRVKRSAVRGEIAVALGTAGIFLSSVLSPALGYAAPLVAQTTSTSVGPATTYTPVIGNNTISGAPTAVVPPQTTAQVVVAPQDPTAPDSPLVLTISGSGAENSDRFALPPGNYSFVWSASQGDQSINGFFGASLTSAYLPVYSGRPIIGYSAVPASQTVNGQTNPQLVTADTYILTANASGNVSWTVSISPA